MNKAALLSTMLAAPVVALVATSFAPAYAFNITQTSNFAGNPSQPLWTVGMTNADIGKTFQVDWALGASASTTPVDLSAFSTFQLTGFTSDYLDLKINITNTTALTSTFTEASILSFGFGIDPNATGVSFINGTGDIFDSARLQTGQQNFPGGFKNIDICIFAANNCSGGRVNDGLLAGTSDSFTIRIAGNFSSGSATIAANLSDFPVKFQTTTGSFELAGAGSTSVEEVPEPITMLGTGAALMFGGLFKRQRDKNRKAMA